jgi:hypothetical protein
MTGENYSRREVLKKMGSQRGRPAACRIGRQRRCHQFETIIQPRGDAMNRPNETARATAHHSETQATSFFFVVFYFQAHRFFLTRCQISVLGSQWR